MSINRRNFLYLVGASAAAAAGARFGSAASLTAAPSISGSEPLSWQAVRDQFNQLTRDRIHLSSFFLTSHPRVVRDEIEKHRRAIDENPFDYLEERFMTMPAVVQAAAAEYLDAKPEEVAITNSTTMGLSHVYMGLPLKAGQEILTTVHDHYVHSEAARLAAERAGATVKKIALFDDIASVSEQDIVSRIKKAVTPKTRVLGITWVHSSTGLKLPIRAIAGSIAEANKGRTEADRIVIVVDGVHGFGVEDETIAETGVDFFVAGTHKWIFGPRGTGIVWAKAENWKNLRLIFPATAMEPFVAWITGKETKQTVQGSWIGQGGFHAFEYAWALPAAFEFHKRIGRTRIAERIHSLNDQCKEGLAAMKHVKLYTPRGNKLSSGLICFEVEGMKSADVVKRLHEKKIIASTAPYREGYVRLAPSLMNTPEEIETTLKEIKAMARPVAVLKSVNASA